MIPCSTALVFVKKGEVGPKAEGAELQPVIPAKAGIQLGQDILDSRFRGNDGSKGMSTATRD